MTQPPILHKVTAFITRAHPDREGVCELLLFEHPFAGNQIPAGTVEDGEAFTDAAIREAHEETGFPMAALSIDAYLGQEIEPLPPDRLPCLHPATVYSRPDSTSFDWARVPRGVVVTKLGRRANGFTHVTYSEYDHTLNPQFVTFTITGWVRSEVLAARQMRHYYRVALDDDSAYSMPPRWTVYTDNHTFTLFWAALDAVPPLIEGQDRWLAVLLKALD